jgi:hypothetical protein
LGVVSLERITARCDAPGIPSCTSGTRRSLGTHPCSDLRSAMCCG